MASIRKTKKMVKKKGLNWDAPYLNKLPPRLRVILFRGFLKCMQHNHWLPIGILKHPRPIIGGNALHGVDYGISSMYGVRVFDPNGRFLFYQDVNHSK